MPIGKRVRKRRRKKKRADSPEKLNSHYPKTLPDTTTEQTKEITQITESPKIQIIPSNSDSRVDELEWVKQNEALLIADLKTRQQAGLPIQVVVRVEKITPSVPEYCQIIPDFCHLDVIREETSASDDDPKKETCECSEKIKNENNFKKLHKDWSSDIDEEKNNELENISESNANETVTSECQLERLESPSLVKESEILRFADIVTTENECVTDLETLGPLKNALKVHNIENNECISREIHSISNENYLISEKHKDDYTVEDVKVNKSPIKHEKLINNCIVLNSNNGRKNQFITNTLLDIESCENKSVYFQKKPIKVFCEDKKVNNFGVLNTNSKFDNCSTSDKLSNKPNLKKDYESLKSFFNNYQDNIEHEEESSDDSTIKQWKAYDYKYKPRRQNKVSIHDKLKQIARLLQDDTDDYEEIQSSQTTSRCVSITSDADIDTDWVSFTLSDGESSKSLCLSPSQSKSCYAPSTISKTSEIIDLHKKFLNRTRSPNLSPRLDIAPSVDILGYNKSRSQSPSKSYSSEVFDEACKMCGTSDKPLSDAECLVSLRKYRETRSRLLGVIQKEQQLNRSVIDRPSSMPTFMDTLSFPDNHTRELMYAEYMEKVKERENRLQNKVIRITKASRPLSSGTLQSLNDIDAEFVTKARERLDKLGVEADVHIEVKDEYYPKHLVDIVPEEEVCIEEVHMNGESSGLRVCVRFCFIFFFTNTVFAVWPSLITLLRYESAEEISKISCKCPSF